MLGPRTYSEGQSTLLQQRPSDYHFSVPDKKKKTSLRKKINSVKSFFADRHRLSGRQGTLSRNASMPDIYNSIGGVDNPPEYQTRKYSQGVIMRDKSRLGAKLSMRPHSECLQLIDENSSLSPALAWMNRSLDDYSPASTISTRSERVYRPPLMIEESEEDFFGTQSNFRPKYTTADSFDSITSEGYNSSLDENHNDIYTLPELLSELSKTSEQDNDDFIMDVDKTMNEIKLNNNIQIEQQQQQQPPSKKLSTDLAPTEDLERNTLVRKSKSFQHIKKKQKFPDLLIGQKYFSAEAEDIRCKKSAPSLEYKDLKFLMEFEARRVLADCSYNARIAARWSKEISGNIRERLRDHTSRNYKIVVNTFIGSVVDCHDNSTDNVHVACRSATDPTSDRFIVAALKSEDLFVTITLLLLKY